LLSRRQLRLPAAASFAAAIELMPLSFRRYAIFRLIISSITYLIGFSH